MGDNIDKKWPAISKNAQNLNEKISTEWKLRKNSGIRTKFNTGNKKPCINYVNSQGDINKDVKVINFITGSQPALKFREYIKTLFPMIIISQTR